MMDHILWKGLGLLVILTCAVNVGAGTEDSWVEEGTLSNDLIDGIDQFILYYFTVELIIVFLTLQNRPGRFLRQASHCIACAPTDGERQASRRRTAD